jgi:hypothetical protein
MNHVPCQHIVIHPSFVGPDRELDYPGWARVLSTGNSIVAVEICCASDPRDAESVFGTSLANECDQPFIELRILVDSARALAAELLEGAARAKIAPLDGADATGQEGG